MVISSKLGLLVPFAGVPLKLPKLGTFLKPSDFAPFAFWTGVNCSVNFEARGCGLLTGVDGTSDDVSCAGLEAGMNAGG